MAMYIGQWHANERHGFGSLQHSTKNTARSGRWNHNELTTNPFSNRSKLEQKVGVLPQIWLLLAYRFLLLCCTCPATNMPVRAIICPGSSRHEGGTGKGGRGEEEGAARTTTGAKGTVPRF